jgi:serine/threonine protein kinase
MTEPANLGKYEIRGILGRGAMGTVYDGWDPIIFRRVAIKSVRLPDAANTETQEELERFKREAQAAGRLHHPNIVGIYDYGETSELAYIVMEFVDGDSLKGLLDKQQRFPVSETARILEQLLTGLQFSHDRGVVHRDIKPANVMMTPAGEVKIADFGIARIENSSMTQAGTVMGTPAYMSPEQFMGQTVDARTDLYSTGVLLYQMLTGERPFEGSMTGIMHKALHTDPPPPSALSVNSPRSMDAVVARAMAKRPEDRFPDAKAFALALRDALNNPALNASIPAAMADEDATVVKGASWPSSAAQDATVVAAQPPRSAAAQPGRRPAEAPPTQIPAALPPTAPPTASPKGSRAPLIVTLIVIVLVVAGGGAWYALKMQGPPAIVAQSPSLAPGTLPTTGTSPSGVQSPPPLTQAQPQPTQTPPPQVQAPQDQTPTPAVAPVATAASINAALKPVGCTLARATLPDPGHVTLDGVSGAGTPETALRDAVSAAAPAATLTSHVRSVDGVYCDALDVLRGANDGVSAPLALALKDNQTQLRNNDDIVLQFTMPDFAGVLLVDYLTSDGKLEHLLSDDGAKVRFMTSKGWKIFGPSKIHAAKTSFSIGYPEPKSPDNVWAVAEPFGTDMIIATASAAPLFSAPRPVDDTPAAYLRDLRAAIASAQSHGVRIATQALPLETAP